MICYHFTFRINTNQFCTGLITGKVIVSAEARLRLNVGADGVDEEGEENCDKV